jgi:hypothetical protein
MARIIVVAERSTGTQVVLEERVVVSHLESDHSCAQLVVINTLLTLLVSLAIHSSFSRYRSRKDDKHRSCYADLNTINTPTCEDFLARLGITIGSA